MFSIFCKFRWFKSSDSTVVHQGSSSSSLIVKVVDVDDVDVSAVDVGDGGSTKLSVVGGDDGSCWFGDDGAVGLSFVFVEDKGGRSLPLLSPELCCETLMSTDGVDVKAPLVLVDVELLPNAPVPFAYCRIKFLVMISTLLTCFSRSSFVICRPSNRVKEGKRESTFAV